MPSRTTRRLELPSQWWRASGACHFAPQDDKHIMVMHISLLLFLFEPRVGALLGPVVALLTMARLSRGMELNAIDALNFGATISILMALATAVDSALVTFGWPGPVLTAGVAIFAVVCIVRAVRSVRRMIPYRYPLAFQLMRDDEPHQIR